MADKINPVATGAPAPKGRFFTPYVVIWAALASGSLLYLALLATQPQLVASFLGTSAHQPSPEVAEANQEEKRAMAEAVSEVRLLRETVDRFRDDLQELKAQVSNQYDREAALMARVGTLETAAAAAAADPQKIAADKKAAAKAAKAAAAEAAPAAAAKATPAAPKKAEGSLETGSVANSDVAVSFGPAVVTPATKTAAKETVPSKQVGIQIASGPSVDSLRLSWTLLSERHGPALRALQPRYTVGQDAMGPTYDLVAGPLKSVAEASQLCQELSAMATPCAVSIFTGDVL